VFPPADQPGVPQFVLMVPDDAGSPATFVFTVHGERTVIVPFALKLMVVGPVYRHPGRGTPFARRSDRVSCFICVLVGGIATGGP
jgi:hypothetical protein